jgi:hydrophobe/amphiphile efflux-1 (HAE1) family protein
MAAFIFFGSVAFRGMGVSELPDVDFPNVNVSISWEGAAPEVVELDVIDVIEGALISLEGVKTISSTARRGVGNVTVEFDLDRDIDIAVQEVQNRLSQFQRQLPRDIDPPIVSKVNPEDRPIMWLAITSTTMTRRDLMAYVRDQIRDRFLAVDGVSDIILGGYVEPNIRVWLDEEKLARLDLTALDVLQAINREHAELPGGLLQTPRTEFTVRMLGESNTLKDFENIIINSRGGRPIYTPITLKDVARIEDDLADVRRISRVNGESAVGLGIRKIRGANTVEVGQAIKKRMDEVARILPQGFEIGVNYDGTVFIEDSIKELYRTLILSGIMTSLVCWFFLGSFGATVNIMLSIPTAIIGSFIVLNLMGFTLNTFTLLALTLAVGLVVDDNIMILENITRYFRLVKTRFQAALQGTAEVTFAAIVSAIAVIAIFLPVGFMEGVIGKYFFEFALTITVAVAFSLVDALTLTPMRASKLMRSENVEGIGPIKWAVKFLTAFYRKALRLSLNYRWLLIGGAIAFFFGTTYFFRALPKEFTPAQDQGRLLLRVQTSMGSSLAYTDEKTREVENILKTLPEIRRFFVAVGGFGGNEANSAMAFVTLQDYPDRPVPEGRRRPLSAQEFANVLRAEFAKLQGVRVFVQDPSTGGIGGRRGYPVEFNLQGGDWEELFSLSRQFLERMNESGHMTDADTNYRGTVPEVHIVPDRERALARGVSVNDIGTTVQATVAGVIAGKYSAGGRRYDIRVKLDESRLDDMDNIKNIRLRNNRGELVALGEVATIERRDGVQTIFREDRARAIGLYANVAQGSSQADAIAYIRSLADEILPPGYFIQETGSSRTFQESFQSLLLVFIIGIAVAYMVLASQFNSFIQPLIILTALPFSISGALISLYVAGLSLNIYSIIGMILLMGIVKKNSIILVDYTNQLREKGMSVRDALEEACPIRLRPILMTSVSTIAGAIPAAIAFGPGSETRIPMAVSVIGGVLVSTLLTLFVVPVFYSLVTREGRVLESSDEDQSNGTQQSLVGN